MSNTNTNVASVSIDEEEDTFLSSVGTFQKKLNDLRADGSIKKRSLQHINFKIKKNNQISKDERKKLLAENSTGIKEANAYSRQHKVEERELQTNAINYVDSYYKDDNPLKNASWTNQKQNLKEEHLASLNKIKEERETELNKINGEQEDTNKKQKISLANSLNKQKVNDENVHYKDALLKIRKEKHEYYLKHQNILFSLRDDKYTPYQKMDMKFEEKRFNFNTRDFLIHNGLYFIFVIFIIVCLCIDPDAASLANILNISEDFSINIFFDLGVAGLIILGGTDLALGRMITISSLITCMIFQTGGGHKFFGLSLSNIYSGCGLFGAAIIAILLSVIACVIFSCFSGFFSAKFKVHPFISTLATSMILWGICILSVGTDSSGVIVDEAHDITGRIGGTYGFPLLLIYAIIALVIVSLIWNRTKFGKSLYAVGGNAEAATVSGISIFWVTLGAFIMAGVLYGIGGFMYGSYWQNANASTGSGTELTSIAAVVVGGVSVTGGVGSVWSVIFGCFVFEILDNFLHRIISITGATGQSEAIYHIFVGLTLVLAVAVDSLKYLKKK